MTLGLFCDGWWRNRKSLRQKGLAVTGVFSPTLTIEASVTDLKPLVMCNTDGQSCIALGGDA
jgi:hypothetical protein